MTDTAPAWAHALVDALLTGKRVTVSEEMPADITERLNAQPRHVTDWLEGERLAADDMRKRLIGGAGRIVHERQRQASKDELIGEGYTREHDQQHRASEFLAAAQAYLQHALGTTRRWEGQHTFPIDVDTGGWPWDAHLYKPSPDPAVDLVKAGALTAAGIDRLSATNGAATTFGVTAAFGINVIEWNEDGGIYCAEGHHDPEQFLEACDVFHIGTVDSPGWRSSPQELPSYLSKPSDVEHIWVRPYNLDDARRDAAQYYDDDPEGTEEERAQHLLSNRTDDGWLIPCTEAEPGAERWTRLVLQ